MAEIHLDTSASSAAAALATAAAAAGRGEGERGGRSGKNLLRLRELASKLNFAVVALTQWFTLNNYALKFNKFSQAVVSAGFRGCCRAVGPGRPSFPDYTPSYGNLSWTSAFASSAHCCSSVSRINMLATFAFGSLRDKAITDTAYLKSALFAHQSLR